MDRGAWWTTVHGVAKSWTQLRDVTSMSFESVMPSNQFILCRPLLLLPSVFSSIRGFSNELTLYQAAKVLEHQLQRQPFQ